MPKSGGLEGVENVSFSCYIPCHNMSISGRRRPRAHLGGFRARPARARPRGRASRAERPDRHSDAVARDPTKGDRASSVQRCRPRTRSFERRTRFVRIVQSAGEASHDEALLQDVAGKREPFRNPILQAHDRQEVDLRILKIESRSRTRTPRQTSDERSLNRYRHRSRSENENS